MDDFGESRDLLIEKITRGIEQLDRGEGVPGEEVRARLRERKVTWRKGGDIPEAENHAFEIRRERTVASLLAEDPGIGHERRDSGQCLKGREGL